MRSEYSWGNNITTDATGDIMLRLGSIVAWAAVIVGAFRAFTGFSVASIDDPESRTFWAARYFGSTSSGEAIDQGIVAVVFGVVLGVLVRIGRRGSRR